MNLPQSLNWKTEGKIFALLAAAFVGALIVPVESETFTGAVIEGFALLKWYAHEHVVLCLLPAFVIAGAVGAFVSQDAVMRHLGPDAPKAKALSVASVSGSILAVCSCTVLPMFGGIYRRGAGLGAAVAFLYSGPAINILAVTLTASVLGAEIGIARAVGAVAFAFVIGLLMQTFFLKEERERMAAAKGFILMDDEDAHPLWETVAIFALMITVLVFANWASPEATGAGLAHAVGVYKWELTALGAAGLGTLFVVRRGWSALWMGLTAVAVLVFAVALPDLPEAAFAVGIAGLMAQAVTRPGEGHVLFEQSWDFAKKIMPLLLIGVFAAGLLLGRPGQDGLMPTEWVSMAVGGNGLTANFVASVLGGLMYFSTLTEVPIVQGLMGAGMGKGPALALLLAGPAISLPNLLVIRTLMGTKKTLVYAALVMVMATLSGFMYGTVFV